MSAATDDLRDHQQQLDMDGVIVGVSRQAIHETLEQHAEMLAALKVSLTALERLHSRAPGGPLKSAALARLNQARAAIAKAEKHDG